MGVKLGAGICSPYMYRFQGEIFNAQPLCGGDSLFHKFAFGISYNVFRFTTFGAGNRAMRSIDPCPKCAGAKPHKGR